MNSNYTKQLQDQIDRFDRLQASVAPGDFANAVATEWIHTGHHHTFDATLVEDPHIEAVTTLGPDGSITEMWIRAKEGRRSSQRIDLEPGSGLWQAMETWREEMLRSEGANDGQHESDDGDWVAAAEYAEEQDERRGDWANPRAAEQPDFPWPSTDDPILAALLASARTSAEERDLKVAMTHLAVHCWFEGGVAGYDRGQADARRELGA